METHRTPGKRATWKTAVIVIGTALLVLATCLWIYDALGAAELARAVQGARAIPGPLTITELLAAQKVWPESKNGAQVILNITPGLKALSDAKDETIQNTLIFGKYSLSELGRRWTPKAEAASGALLEQHRAELAAIDTLGKYEGGRFPVEWTDDFFSTLLPHLSLLRTSVKLKELDAIERAMRGDVSRLADDFEVMLRHSDLVHDEPLLISMLVGIACAHQAIDGLQICCSLANVEPAQLERIEKLLLPLEDGNARMELAIRGERAAFLGCCDYIRKRGTPQGVGAPLVMGSVSKIPGAQGFLMRDEAEGLRLLSGAVEAIKTARGLEYADEMDVKAAQLGPTRVLSRSFLPSLRGAFGRNAALSARFRATRVALAAERYRRAKGEFPKSLETLVPEYIEAIPLDPCAPGQPLKLRVDEKYFVVYGAGENGIDNDGDVVSFKKGLRPSDAGFALVMPAARNLPPLPETQEADEDTEDDPSTSAPASQPSEAR